MDHRLFFEGARLRSEEMRMNNSQIWSCRIILELGNTTVLD